MQIGFIGSIRAIGEVLPPQGTDIFILSLVCIWRIALGKILSQCAKSSAHVRYSTLTYPALVRGRRFFCLWRKARTCDRFNSPAMGIDILVNRLVVELTFYLLWGSPIAASRPPLLATGGIGKYPTHPQNRWINL